MGGDELRPVTALFADVVGSTRLGERLGPDEVKALIGECVTRMSRAVETFGGTVQAYMGDGICAYFGVPAAHEDDPERAARAGLQILEVVGEYRRDIVEAWGIEDFNVRVGVNSGQTAVGEVGAGDPQTVALGDTTNVAARLQSAAEPGSIAVGSATARRLTQGFVLEPLGPLPVKGRAEPVESWRLVGPRPQQEAPPTTPFIDRDQELARLAAVVEEWKAGRGQVLLLSGEPGTGKTRLVAELRSMAGEETTWLEGRCTSYLREVASRPFIQALRTWVGAGEDEPELVVRTKLRARLGSLFGAKLDEALPYLARMLSIRLDPETDERLRSLRAEELEAGIRQAYRDWIERLAATRPVALVLESFESAYVSSRELAEELLETTERAPLLLVVAFRPDPTSEAWLLRLRALADFPHRATELAVGPLPEDAGLALVDSLLPPGLLPDAFKVEIVRRAEGNPLYVEELLQAVAAAGGGDRRRTWSIGVDPTAVLPPALESLFVARIDRLPPGPRRLAQEAAVIGRTFPVAVLKRVTESDDVDGELAALLRADVVRELRRYPQLECTFKHGLVQEAALSTLTPTHRKELYGKVGRAFEEELADAIDDHVATLAFYFYRSDDQATALRYLERAASQADEAGVRAEAAELWERARKVAVTVGDEDAARRASDRLERGEPS